MRTVIALAAMLVSTSAVAMNGLRPIGVSAASRSLGGTGVASYYNHYEAIYRNPSLMAHSPMTEGSYQASFGMTLGSFKPRVKATYGEDQEYKTPANKTSGIFPSVFGIGQKVSQQLSWGMGVYGGGGGADYGDAESVYRSESRTAALSWIPGVSWAFGQGSSIGINTSMTHVDVLAENDSITKGGRTKTGGSDITFGLLLGASHRSDQLTLGASIAPPTTALLKEARDIDEDGTSDNLLFTAMPLEVAVGASWQDEQWSLQADYRFLQWSNAEFLKSVGWKDQHVLALGYSYGQDHRLRLGFNMSNVIVVDHFDQDGFATTLVSQKPMINLAGDAFVATSGIGVTTHHYTVGSFHKLNESLNIESAMVYMAPGSIERAGGYDVPTGRKVYGWRSEFSAVTVQIELGYRW